MFLTRRLHYAAFVLLALFWASPALADVGTYAFIEGTGSAYDLTTGATDLFYGDQECSGRTNIDDNASSTTNIGFTFTFDNIDYTKFSVSTNGLVGLFRSWGDTRVSTCWENELATPTGGCFGDYSYTLDSIAQITALWDDLRVPSTCNDDGFDGTIRYKLFGSAPNRVLVIEFDQIEVSYYDYYYGSFQVRLYEGSNKIEFWYGGFERYSADGASIGLAGIGGRSFMSVTPGSPASVSTSVVDDAVDPTTISANTLYTFAPCAVRFAGDVGQGGTVTMTAGDSLLVGKQVQVGSTGSFEPFSITLDQSPCEYRDFDFSIIGIGASEYTITPTGGTITSGETITPTITYTPTCAGSSNAMLRVTSSDGGDRLYTLAATATPQTSWIGNVSEGGTTALADGDTLLAGIQVRRLTTDTFQPLTIRNTNLDPAAPPANVSFTLDDPSGQYSISTTTASLAGGQSISPTITFAPTGVSFQEATLTVADDCETRTYLLRAFSAAPGGLFFSEGVQLDSTSSVFTTQPTCVGTPNIAPIIMTNTGTGDFVLTGFSIYRTDTTYRQGTSPYPLLLDDAGQPIPSPDYILTTQPGSGPITTQQPITLPFIVPQGQSRTIYAVFVGSEPGRRYARVFLETNGDNLIGTDVFGVEGLGRTRFDVIARSVGSMLTGADGRRPRSIVMPEAHVDDTTTASLTITNGGACDLLIERRKLRIFAGDTREFALVSVLPSTPYDAATESYRLAPNASDQITVRFTPSRSGTRMATMMLQTNDSTIQLPGLTERGAYYIDIHGRGIAGLDAKDLVLAPVLVGGTVRGVATLENSSTTVVDIRQISIVGPDAAEFQMSSTLPWPALPVRVLPGSRLDLGVELTPVGAAGMRRAVLEVITTTNDTINVGIRGEAGTTAILVTPSSLFDDAKIVIGQYVRQTVAISNVGTFPIRLQLPYVTGADSLNYSLGTLPRLDLFPGQTEYLEVTFQPLTQGQSSATLEIPTSIGLQTVQLGGEVLSAFGGDDDDDLIEDGNDRDGVSGIGVTGAAGALRIDAVRPNPASGPAELDFVVGNAGDVTITVHDATGRFVGQLVSGRYEAGRHSVRFDATRLPSGVYHLRLACGGSTTSTTVNVAR